jgi:hypothetical protein
LTENSVEQFVRWYLDRLSGAEPAGHHSSRPGRVPSRTDAERPALKAL